MLITFGGQKKINGASRHCAFISIKPSHFLLKKAKCSIQHHPSSLEAHMCMYVSSPWLRQGMPYKKRSRPVSTVTCRALLATLLSVLSLRQSFLWLLAFYPLIKKTKKKTKQNWIFYCVSSPKESKGWVSRNMCWSLTMSFLHCELDIRGILCKDEFYFPGQ